MATVTTLESLQSGITVTEARFPLSDGLQTYTKTYTPSSPPIAQTLFIHGFSDHLDTYTFFPLLVARSSVLHTAYDLRGFGLTSPAKSDWGNTGPTSLLISDLDALIASRLALHPELPFFLIGHSMGGALALTYAACGAYKDKLAGVVVWSPLIELAPASKPWAFTEAAGRVAAKVAPKRQMISKLDSALMSRDPEVCKGFETDPMCHDTGTLEGLSSMLDRGRKLREGLGKGVPSGCSVLVLHGTGDGVTDWRESEKFVKGLTHVQDKEFKAFEGWYHKMHAEPGEDKVRFGDEVAEWIILRAKGAAVGGAKL